MELEGLRRTKEKLDAHSISVKILITDRHVQIQKWVREQWPAVTHYFDIWHVAKGQYFTFQFLQMKFKIPFEVVRAIMHDLICRRCR